MCDKELQGMLGTPFPKIIPGLICLGVVLLANLLFSNVDAQDAPPDVIEVQIADRKVVSPGQTIRTTQGNVVELRWTSNEAVELHLHGYDIEVDIPVSEPTVMIVKAFATGRFPITSHRWGKGGGGHDALLYLEVHPR